MLTNDDACPLWIRSVPRYANNEIRPRRRGSGLLLVASLCLLLAYIRVVTAEEVHPQKALPASKPEGGGPVSQQKDIAPSAATTTNQSDAQQVRDTPAPATGGSTKRACPDPNSPSYRPARVVGVVGEKGKPEVELGDVILVTVRDYETLDGQARCFSPEKNIVLYLDERPVIKGTAYPPSDPKADANRETTLRFTLQPSYEPESGARDVWTHILGAPSLQAARPVRVSVGIENLHAIDAEGNEIRLRVVPIKLFIFWLLIFTVLLIAFLLLARRTNLLREGGLMPPGASARPYSLARTQLAWWFFIVLAAYLFIGIITGDASTSINTTVLSLLGISAGTTLGAAVVDASKANLSTETQQKSVAQTLQAEIESLEQQVAALKPAPGDVAGQQRVAELQTEKAAKQSQLNKLRNRNEHFLQDILGDVNGVSFHRFQIAAWTFVLGMVFCYRVYKQLAMPTFDAALLTLLGISAGTYVGMKIPEPTVPK